MSTKSELLPFKEYPSTLARYSNSDQLQAHQYKSIIESQLGQGYYQREFPSVGDAALTRLNANVPVSNNKVGIIVDDVPINVYEQFWQYKHNGGTIFTDWTSAGQANLNTDISISHMPLYGDKKLQDPNLVLSNTNNVRNNLQNYGKEYLTTTNLLNSMAFTNGLSYQSGSLSPIRQGTSTEIQQIEHSNFANKENGDLMSRQIKQLDVNLPSTYANSTRSDWVYINPAFIRPNNKLKIFHQKLKFVIFDLDSLKLTGTSCLTKSFNVTPKGFNGPVDVVNDRHNFAPLSNPNYYSDPQHNINGIGSNMYCSANTNYVAMPKNHMYPNLDTSFQVMPGNNSITLGTVMSPKLMNFIQNDLFNFNRNIILMQIYNQLSDDDDARNNLRKTYPNVFKNQLFTNRYDRKVSMYEAYMELSEGNKYKFMFNQQRNFAAIYKHHPELDIFITHLSIFKFSGNDVNNPGLYGSVYLREINSILGLTNDEHIPIHSPGCFLLLPTMLSQDVFGVRLNIPEELAGNVNEINKSMEDLAKYEREHGLKYASYSPINNNKSNTSDPNECITHTNPYNYELNATNCAFRDTSGKWIQKQNPNYVPHMFNDPNNLNNDIDNLVNPYGGANPLNAPLTF